MTDQNSPGNDEELKLSPSETMAHNSAMRLAGAGKGRRSTQRALASIVLGFELFIVFLGGMTVFGLGAVQPRELGIFGGLALCVLILVALATMRTKVGIWIGWGVHAAMFLAGFILPMFIIIAVIFTALWVYCMITGARMDRQAAARFGQAAA